MVNLSVPDRESFLAEPHVAALSVTDAGSRKDRLIAASGRFTLMVERGMPTVRYVSVEGPVTRRIPGTGALLLEMSERYLPPDQVPAYVKFVNTELGEQVAIYLRPERWLTADLGPGAVPPGMA